MIAVLAPRTSEPIRAPFPIELRFEAQDDAAIVPDTFRVRYGVLRLDITERVVTSSLVTPQGIRVPAASVPSGDHTLRLSIADNRNRVGEMIVKITVVA
jgi:hypothetical protein